MATTGVIWPRMWPYNPGGMPAWNTVICGLGDETKRTPKCS